MADIAVLLHRERNRSLLADWIANETAHSGVPIAEATEVRSRDIDLCILDGYYLEESQSSLQEAKTQAAPRFLPYLLLIEQTRAQSQRINVWDHVDDIIWQSPNKPLPANSRSFRFELKGRLESLLRLRTDSITLDRQRRELQRKDEQLEGFATAITHELRNSVSIVSGYADLVSQGAAGTAADIQSWTEKINDEVADMEDIVDQLKTLARYSQTISETKSVNLEDVARWAKRQSDTDGVNLVVESSISVEAEEERLRELFTQAFKFAAQNDAAEVIVKGCSDGFCIIYDGPYLAGCDEAAVFAYGNAVPDADSAMLLPNLQILATSHGWQTKIENDDSKGSKLVVKGVYTSR